MKILFLIVKVSPLSQGLNIEIKVVQIVFVKILAYSISLLK